MGMNMLGPAGLEMRFQARRIEVQSQLGDAERTLAYVEEDKKLRHQRRVAALHCVIAQVEAALGKVHDGTYGHCDGCGSQISDSELKHEPATTLCAVCRGHQPDAA